MNAIVLISAWVSVTIAYDEKVSGNGCDTVLSSVRMEVSPALLQLVCGNTNQTTLVVDCGSSIWYEKVTGFCNSFDLNIGQVLMNQPLPSSTITLQLVKSGQVLDAARVAILTSEHLGHYRISVWGHMNTRFLLEIAQGCKASQKNNMPGTHDRYGHLFLGNSPRHPPQLHVNNQLPMSVRYTDNSLPQTYPSGITDDDIARIPEYLRPNKLANGNNNYAFLKMQKFQTGRQSGSDFGGRSTNIELYRSKASRPESGAAGEQQDEEDGDDELMTTTPESSEIAKLRWMEEKRLLFEERMKFLRNFYPDFEGTTENESPSLDETADQTEGVLPNGKDTDKLLMGTETNKYIPDGGSSVDSLRQTEDTKSTRYTESLANDHDPAQIRKSDNLQLNAKDSKNEEHKKLEYRQLSHSESALLRNNDMKQDFTEELHPSAPSVSTTLSLLTALAHKAILNNNKNIKRTENSDKVYGVEDAGFVNSNSLITLQGITIHNDLLSVLKKPINQRLFDSEKNIQQLFKSSDPPVIDTTLMDISQATLNTRGNQHIQGTANSISGDTFTHKQTHVQTTPTVTGEGLENVKPPATVGKVASISVGNVLPNVTSQFQREFQQKRSSSVSDAVQDSTAPSITTASSTRAPTATQLPTALSILLSSSISYKQNNLVQLLPNISSREPYAPSPSSAKISLNQTMENPRNADANTPATHFFRTTIKPPTSESAEHNITDSVTSPTLHPFPHSAPLEMKSSTSHQPSAQIDLSYVVDKQAKQTSTALQPRLVDKQSRLEGTTSVVTSNRPWNANDNPSPKKAYLKTNQDTIKSFVKVSKVTSSASSNGLSKVPATILKRESNVASTFLETANGFINDTGIRVTASKDKAETTESSLNMATSPLQTNTGTSQISENGPQDMGDDVFWPVVAALVIGIPAVIILVVAITVIHKKRLEDPARQACIPAIPASPASPAL